MAPGKCPRCEKACGSIKLEEVDASVPFGDTIWKAVNYLCPWCNTILSTSIDPVALKTDIVNHNSI